ncbi:MAG: hypothetical protein JWO05_285 [Gemmatimonadetes bacterium]|nr:hypothetical protein [Gemmatimonadota bacterium]
MRLIPLFLLLAIAAPALAQQPDGIAVSGVVWDSISRHPLAHAAVQLAAPGSVDVLYSAESDEAGRFELPAVKPGKYLATFYHYAVDTLGLVPPVRAIEIDARRNAFTLSTPSAKSVTKAICGRAVGDSLGAIYVRALDASTGVPLVGAVVVASWSEIVIRGRRIAQEDPQTQALTTEDGWASLCGLPADAEIALQMMRGTDSTGQVVVRVPASGFVRRDLRIGGVARVTGFVHDERGLVVPNADVRLGNAMHFMRTDTTGHFSIGEAPAGTQRLEARAIGYVIERRTVELAANTPADFDVLLPSRKSVLDTIKVVAQRIYDRDFSGFEERRRGTTNGKFVTASDIDRLRPNYITDLLRGVSGARIESHGGSKMVSFRGVWGRCSPPVWLDGTRVPLDETFELDMAAVPEQLRAVEIYPAGAFLPPQFMWGSNECGAIVLWSKK